MTDGRLVDMIIKRMDLMDAKLDKVQDDVSYLKATDRVTSNVDSKKVLAGGAGISTVITAILIGVWDFIKNLMS